MKLYHCLRQRQAEAGATIGATARLVAAIEPLEHVLSCFERDSGAAVADEDVPLPARARCIDADLAAWRRVPDRVVKEVVQRPSEEVRVGFDSPIGGNVSAELDLLLPRNGSPALDGFLEQVR